METTNFSTDPAEADNEWTHSPSFKVKREAKAVKVMFCSESLLRVVETETEIQGNSGHLNFLKASILHHVH